MQSIGQRIVDFYQSLHPPLVPAQVEILFPQQRQEVISVIKAFFNKFYSDNKKRHVIFGINPGRFGAGITGVNFTAPKQLKEYCGIDHSFKAQTELSAEFIYEMIVAYGGVKEFYHDFFISSVCPLGFIRKGVNMNYYDDPKLLKAVTPFIIDSLEKQLELGFHTDKCFCIGGDKNLKFFSAINAEHHFFGKIVPLAHPRFIMQYRRRTKQAFIDQYLSTLRDVS